ncbi:MAG: hypothetical protein ABI967_06935 [bacterium]
MKSEAALRDAEQLRPGVVVVEIPLDIKKGEAGLSIAHGNIERFGWRSLFNNKLVEGLVNAAGRTAKLCGIRAIEPVSGPRKAFSKTRTVKKEFGTTANCSLSNCFADLIPFSWFKSISIEMLPLATIIFSRVPVWLSWLTGFFDLSRVTELSALLIICRERAAWSEPMLICLSRAAELSEPSLKSIRSGSRGIRRVFNIVWDSNLFWISKRRTPGALRVRGEKVWMGFALLGGLNQGVWG